MKKSNIRVGAVYTNGKNRFRKVVALGNYRLYEGQRDGECVRYLATRINAKGEEVADTRAQWPGDKPFGRCTLTAFASWAKGLREPSEGSEVRDDAFPRASIERGEG